MPEIADIKIEKTDAVQNTQPVVQVASVPATQSNMDHTKIKGNFSEYRSGYWALMLPLLSARYSAEALNTAFKPVTRDKTFLGIKGTKADNVWSIALGMGMMAVTAFYSNRTYQDMKSQFREPLAWEFDKPPEKVGMRDMFRSKNTLVHDTVKNFTKRTALRTLVQLPFFTYLIPTPFKKHLKPDELITKSRLLGPKDSVVAGAGSNAIYLASDALGRKKTFFEDLQSFVDNKINHRSRIGELVTAADLINLYELQAHNNKSVPHMPKMNTPEWQADLKLFERMADLMNQTYQNTPKKEHADFTVPKLVYLLGMGLLKSDNLEKHLAYVEVANLYGIPEVKKAEQALKNGASLKSALAGCPTPSETQMQDLVSEQPVKSFAHEGLKKSRPDTPAATHTEKAIQMGEGTTQSIGV